jgi:hypothetical protein
LQIGLYGGDEVVFDADVDVLPAVWQRSAANDEIEHACPQL